MLCFQFIFFTLEAWDGERDEDGDRAGQRGGRAPRAGQGRVSRRTRAARDPMAAAPTGGWREGGVEKQEESAAGPGTRRRDLGEALLRPSRAPPGQRAAHKGAGEPEPPAAAGHRGERAARGRCGAPRPAAPPSGPPWPHPSPTAPSATNPTRSLSPYPYSQSLGRSLLQAAPLLGTCNPQRARTLCAL